ncbi:MAG: PilN domain-containing protein [Gemmatimonadota bacterium]|nr:PilN domain-containing protein [Gemmatimonadota bacterium]
MTNAIGVALEPKVLRVVQRVRGVLVAKEIPWDPQQPEAVVDRLMADVGRPRVIALAIGLGFLEVARPDLPPLASADRLRLLRRDADRYFPLEGLAAVADASADGVAFGMPSEQLQRWVAAFGMLAPVRAVVAAPDGIASAMCRRGMPAQSLVIEAAVDERGVMRHTAGRVTEARRMPYSMSAGAVNGSRSIDELTIDSTTGRFTSAIGALEALSAPLETMLLDVKLERSLQRVRRQRTWISYGLFAAMLALLVTAANLSRERTLLAVRHGVDGLDVTTAPAVALQKKLASLDNEARTLAARQAKPNGAFEVMGALSRTLPPDVFVQRLEWNGSEWRLDGSANQAASIIPRLDGAGLFRNVRVLSASTRFRDGDRMRESFSIGFETNGGAGGKH